MKKTIIILIALLALTVGGLYTTFAQLDIEAETTDYTSINSFPYEMPNIVIDPMVGVPLY